MMVFLGILVVGFVYEWMKGALSGINAMSIEGTLDKGFITTSLDSIINWGRTGSMCQ